MWVLTVQAPFALSIATALTPAAPGVVLCTVLCNCFCCKYFRLRWRYPPVKRMQFSASRVWISHSNLATPRTKQSLLVMPSAPAACVLSQLYSLQPESPALLGCRKKVAGNYSWLTGGLQMPTYRLSMSTNGYNRPRRNRPQHSRSRWPCPSRAFWRLQLELQGGSLRDSPQDCSKQCLPPPLFLSIILSSKC
jgi:hypothetical protein